jgi:hypothetical protein
MSHCKKFLLVKDRAYLLEVDSWAFCSPSFDLSILSLAQSLHGVTLSNPEWEDLFQQITLKNTPKRVLFVDPFAPLPITPGFSTSDSLTSVILSPTAHENFGGLLPLGLALSFPDSVSSSEDKTLSN